jgi:hypothetical protein
MIKIETTEDRGRIVVATTDLDPAVAGIEVLLEDALVIFPPSGSSKDCAPCLPIGFPRNLSVKLWSDYWHYMSQSKETKAKILDFYVDLDCTLANNVRAGMMPFASYENLDVEEFVLVNMVINFNAVIVNPVAADGSGQGTTFGSGLFETACRLSHSCRPNCCWFSSQDGSKKIVRAITLIQKGEELTINYRGDDELLVPMYSRRKSLRKSKFFDCRCKRCKSNYDDTRRFKCASKKCLGVHFVRQAEEEDAPVILACSVCSKEATKDFAMSLLKQERTLKSEIENIEYIADHGLQIDVTDRIKKLCPFHPFHYLSELCYKIQGELYMQIGDFRAATRANTSMLACRDGIFGEDYPVNVLAFACERLGDSLQHVDLGNAEKIYQRSVRVLQITYGLSHPYSTEGRNKLMSVQRRLWNPSDKSDHCALCGAVSTKKCSRCDQVVYCSRDHQMIHWKGVHKKQCKPKKAQTTD